MTRRRLNIGAILQVGCLLILSLVVFHGHPPADAQEHPQAASEDVERYIVTQHDKEIEDLKIKDQKLWEAINANTNAIADLNGQERGIGGLLALFNIGTLVFQIKKGKSA